MKLSGKALLGLGLDKTDADAIAERAASARSLEDGEAVVQMAIAALGERALGVLGYLDPLGATVALYAARQGWGERTVVYDVESGAFSLESGHTYLARWLRQNRELVADLQ